MEPWVADLIKDISGVIVGWALGLASALVVEWWKERRKIGAIKVAVLRELRETAYRLLCIVYKAEGRRGGLSRQLLEWMHPQVQRYAGPNPSEGFLAGVAGLLARSDAELAQLAAYEKVNTPPQFWPREEASYAMAAAAQAHDLEPDYTVRLLDILSHLRMFNEVRENGIYYSRLTFAPGPLCLTPENHAKAVQNADAADEQIARRARIIVDRITALEEKEGLRSNVGTRVSLSQ